MGIKADWMVTTTIQLVCNSTRCAMEADSNVLDKSRQGAMLDACLRKDWRPQQTQKLSKAL